VRTEVRGNVKREELEWHHLKAFEDIDALRAFVLSCNVQCSSVMLRVREGKRKVRRREGKERREGMRPDEQTCWLQRKGDDEGIYGILSLLLS
jgi:hypothetical protein